MANRPTPSTGNKQAIYREIEETLGLVPSFIKEIPDNTLEAEWNLFKTVEFEEGPIPAKYRELIGLAVAAASKCRYCSYFHTEAAKVNGATNEEIEDAVHFAKHASGWSTYLNGLQTNYDEFKYEVDRIVQHVSKQMGVKPGMKSGMRQ